MRDLFDHLSTISTSSHLPWEMTQQFYPDNMPSTSCPLSLSRSPHQLFLPTANSFLPRNSNLRHRLSGKNQSHLQLGSTCQRYRLLLMSQRRYHPLTTSHSLLVNYATT